MNRLGKKAAGSTVREIRSHANKYLQSLLMSMKSGGWHTEQEWRILVVQAPGEKAFEPFLTPKGVCCFELPICTAAIVKEIVMAPQFIGDPNSVRGLMSDAGMASVPIRRTLCECS